MVDFSLCLTSLSLFNVGHHCIAGVAVHKPFANTLAFLIIDSLQNLGLSEDCRGEGA